MKNTLKRSIFLILIFSTVALFISWILYIMEQNIMNQVDNKLLTQDSIKFSIENNKQVDLDTNLLDLDGDYLLYKENVGLFNGYAIYFKGDLKNKPNVLKGRYFNQDDFNNGKKVAVIGKGLMDKVIKEDGKDYYYIENENYEVIGVLGDDKKASGDDYNVYINLDALLTKDSFYLKGKYAIDAGKNSKNILNEIKSKYKDTDINIVEAEPEVISPIAKSIKENVQAQIVFILEIIGTFVLNTVCVTEYWIKNRKKEIGIKRALGATKRRIFVSIIGELITINIISFVVGYGIYIITSYVMDGYIHFYLGSTLIAFAITLISALSTAIVPIYNANKIQPAQILR